MADQGQRIQITQADGKVVDADLLKIMEVDGKRIAIYMIENSDGSVDIVYYYVIKTEGGFDQLKEIEDADVISIATDIGGITQTFYVFTPAGNDNRRFLFDERKLAVNSILSCCQSLGEQCTNRRAYRSSW